jgi:virulence-associated protein VagC
MSAYFRYVEISRGGGQYEFKEEVHQQVLLPDFLFSKAYAQETRVHKETRYPLLHLGGNLLLENCSFRNNNSSAVRIGEQEMNFDNLSGPLVKIVNSNFENNKPGVAFSSEFDCPEKEESNCGNLFLLKNNWYDSPVGPNLIKINWEDYLKYLDSYESPLGYGERVVGEFVNIEGFRQKSLIADPLVIVPGIMGSAEEMVGKDLVLDPILHSYDEMVDSLKDNGYQEGVNLFTFPYNWRKSNVMTADKLSQKIQQIKQETGLMYVDIAAHSMGGLVARQYIQRKGYSYDVDQLITMGTPHKGSPKAYLMWEGGEFPGG